MTAGYGRPSPLDLVAREIAEKTQALVTLNIEQRMAQSTVAVRLCERPALRVDEAAALIGVSRQFLVGYVNSGELPSVKLGTQVRLILRADLDAWLLRKRDSPD